MKWHYCGKVFLELENKKKPHQNPQSVLLVLKWSVVCV